MSPTTVNLEADNWSEFLKAIRQVRQEMNSPQILWYRGHAKLSYTLIPSLLRDPKWLKKEQVIFEEYEKSAAYLMDAKLDSWEMLQDMQHYGIPTRLLDWTDVLGIAVAFSLYDSNDSEDSSIFVLDPLKLNDKSGIVGIKRPFSDPSFDYKTVYWQGKPFYPAFPIAIDGRLHNDRLRAQSGTFTVHGRDSAPLDEQIPNIVRKITLRSSAKPDAREFLEHANLNPFKIYPDMVGMARHIIRKHLTS
jgi:hypothetical protein